MLLAESEFNGSELENRNANEETSLCLLTPYRIERKGVKEAPWSQSYRGAPQQQTYRF